MSLNEPTIVHVFGRMEVKLTEMQPTADGHGNISVETGKRSGLVMLQIDPVKLRGLALQALKNKRLRANLAGGGVVAIVKRGTVRDIPTEPTA